MNIVQFGLVPELELDGKEASLGFQQDCKYYILELFYLSIHIFTVSLVYPYSILINFLT